MQAPIAITVGEPAGIGPDLCVLLAQQPLPAPLVLIADSRLLAQRAQALGLPWRALPYEAAQEQQPTLGALPVIEVPLAAPTVAGKLNPANSSQVLRTVEIAADGCLDGRFSALVTAPINKAVINEAGIAFSGHTEFLAERMGSPHVVMMLVGGGLRVALVTTHIPVKDVARAITREALQRTLAVLHADLRTRFGIAKPRIGVAGLNPHAGESGYLGREEIDIIAPALDDAKRAGIEVSGPLPADTLFTRQRLKDFDCVLAMYHDQGLPVLKYASFGHGVNVTLGLPIIRTSVDHGTALELAGTGHADLGSLRAAIELAAVLARSAA